MEMTSRNMSLRIKLCFLLFYMFVANVACSTVSIQGVFQKSSSVAIFNTALQHPSIEGNSIFLSKQASLFNMIEMMGNLGKELRDKAVNDITVFTDFTGGSLEILQEVIRATSNGYVGNKTTGMVRLNSLLNGDRKLLNHKLVINELSSFVDSIRLPSGISVIVDDSQYGELTMSTILQKSNRKISSVQTISNSSIDRILTQIGGARDNTFLIVDADAENAANFVAASRRMGLAGFSGMFSWMFFQRAKRSLASICSRPEGHYLLFEYKEKPLTANDVLKAVLNCDNDSITNERVNCTHIDSSSSNVQTLRLWSGEKTNKWLPLQPHEKTLLTNFNIHLSNNPIWPRRRVVIANTYRPWVIVLDFNQTRTTDTLCGLGGRYGARYENATSNVTIPICAYGLAIDILKSLEDKLEFVGEIHVSRDGLYGSYNETTGVSNGIIREIMQDQADIALDLMEDSSRTKVVEFTTPLTVASNAIAYVQGNTYNSSVFGPFDTQLWVTILCCIVGLMFFVWLIERVSPHCKAEGKGAADESVGESFGPSESMNYSWGIFFSGEIIDRKPRAFGSHVTLIVFSFFSILILAAYSANLIAFFVVLDEKPLITGIYDQKLVGEDSRLRSGIIKATSIANFLQFNPDERLNKLYHRAIFFSSFSGMYSALKSGKIHVAIADTFSLKHEAGYDKDCAVKVIPIKGSDRGIGIVFRKGSTWKNRLNQAVMFMSSSGASDKLLNTWFSSKSCTRHVPFIQLSLKEIGILFYCLCYGLAGCLIVTLVLAGWTVCMRYVRGKKQMISFEQST